MSEATLHLLRRLQEHSRWQDQRIRDLEAENKELKRINQEMYFYGQDLVERVRMEPTKVRILKNESQTK